MLRTLLGLVFAVVCLALAVPAAATDREYSPYEQESLRRALTRMKVEIDEHPEGKRVEAIDVVTLDVIEDRDPAPSFLNWFHVTSRPYVIRREILLRPGDRFDASLMRESERNLRTRQISVVLVVPIKGSTPDLIKLLVVTKDVWTLRMNTEPQIVNGKLAYLSLEPSEENLLGLHKTVNGLLQLTRSNYSMGLGFVDPRVAGSRLLARARAALIFNCQSNDIEGSFGTLFYGKPLYSTRAHWAWGAAVSWSDAVVRPAGTIGDSICTGGRSALLDFASTEEDDRVPYQYRRSALLSQYSVTRSFGILVKNDISFGLEATRQSYSAPAVSDRSPQIQREFARLLPVADARLGPFVQLHAYRNRFMRVVNFETLGLQEDHRLGHDVWLRLYPTSSHVGSTRTLLGAYAGLGYTLQVGDGLWRNYVSSTIELSSLERSDAEVSGGTRFVTPQLGFGRFVYDATALHRYRNYLNPISTLGGTTRLRGYEPSAFFGPDYFASNLEFRSRPVQILSVQLGAVAFWDMGDAFRGLEDLELKHGAGVGLRFLAPQVDRSVFRIDVGFPLDPSVPGSQTSVVAQFYQAFGMPGLAPSALVP